MNREQSSLRCYKRLESHQRFHHDVIYHVNMHSNLAGFARLEQNVPGCSMRLQNLHPIFSYILLEIVYEKLLHLELQHKFCVVAETSKIFLRILCNYSCKGNQQDIQERSIKTSPSKLGSKWLSFTGKP
jgi:hypothetical protein